MAIEITMPRLSDTMEEGTLIKWLVKVGDKVASGDHLADVETDKATMELTAFDDGTVAKLAADEGQTMKVGDVIAVLAVDGESVEAAARSGGGGKAKADTPAKATKEKDEPAAEAAKPAKAAATQEQDGGGSRQRVSPLARKLAEEHGVDLATIKGTGPDGRIIKRDILSAAPGSSSGSRGGGRSEAARTPAAPVAAVKLEDKTVPLSGMRKTIAKRLVESKTTMPHFQVTVSVNADPLLDLRKTINTQLESQGVKLSVNDFIVRGVALALARHPQINSSWNGDSIQQHGAIHIGVAVALPAEKGGGLVVPVIRDALHKGVRQISDDTRRLAKKARESGLSGDDMAGGTFTLSNLGMFGVDHFTAIINPPQAAILAVGAALQKAVVRDNHLAVGHEMSLTMSSDHRVIDGAMAAEFLVTLKQLLEAPAAMLV
jgi:pyruvate dehydrogenase E2 component (dihydrolipoamide acetyltransferase)